MVRNIQGTSETAAGTTSNGVRVIVYAEPDVCQCPGCESARILAAQEEARRIKRERLDTMQSILDCLFNETAENWCDGTCCDNQGEIRTDRPHPETTLDDELNEAIDTAAQFEQVLAAEAAPELAQIQTMVIRLGEDLHNLRAEMQGMADDYRITREMVREHAKRIAELELHVTILRNPPHGFEKPKAPTTMIMYCRPCRQSFGTVLPLCHVCGTPFD